MLTLYFIIRQSIRKSCDICREQAFIEAANKPLFSKPSRSSRNVAKYPFVFDLLLTAQQSGAYVGGCKVLYELIAQPAPTVFLV